MIRARCEHCKKVVEDFIIVTGCFVTIYCSSCYYTEGYDKKDKKP